MAPRWIRHPLGWHRPDDMFVYRGDFRLRLHSIDRKRSFYGVGIDAWEVIFEKGLAMGVAGGRSFTGAVIRSIWKTYMRYLEWDDHPPAWLPTFAHRFVLR